MSPPGEPTVTRILESALYVGDVERSREFYEDVFGFRTMVHDEKFAALSVADRQVLLIFERGTTSGASKSPGGTIPAHDGRGELHLAFAIPASERTGWEERLRARKIPIESTVRWSRGGTSLYFRDPARHLVELTTPGLWEIY